MKCYLLSLEVNGRLFKYVNSLGLVSTVEIQPFPFFLVILRIDSAHARV